MKPLPPSSGYTRCKKCGGRISVNAKQCHVCGAYTSRIGWLVHTVNTLALIALIYLAYTYWDVIQSWLTKQGIL